MPIIATDQLIKNYLAHNDYTIESQRKMIIKPITDFFEKHTPTTLQSLLISHGLFQAEKTTKKTLIDWVNQEQWTLINNQFKSLMKEWNGPDVAIFILPVDFSNHVIQKSFHGVTGVSFADNIILFINHRIQDLYIKALLAHEYSHTIRLRNLHNQQDLISLKDTIILEGIAEVITQRKYGVSFLSKDKVNEETIKKSYLQWIKPHLSIRSNHPLHSFIMYGGDQLEQRIGYQVGTYIVKSWLKMHPVNLVTLFREPTESFFKSLE